MCDAGIQTAKDLFLDRLGFILNKRAGMGRSAETIGPMLERLKTAGRDVRVYSCPASPGAPARQALADGCGVLVACGGDGTVSGVAAVTHGSPAALAVFPTGTLNHFATDLGLTDRTIAEEVLLNGRPVKIDAARVNGRLFINNSGIGVYPAIVLEREAVRRRGIPKLPAFLISCVKALANLPFLKLQLEADGDRLARVTPFLFVGNNVYTCEGRGFGHRSRLDEAQLVIFTARHSGPTGLIRIAFRVLLSRLRESRDITVIKACRLSVHTKWPVTLDVSLDGEIVTMTTPLEYETLPCALRVLAP